MTERLQNFLRAGLTAYHACDEAKAVLLENGFTPLSETEDWLLSENGKYFVERNGSIIAFTVGALDTFSYKIVASHVDSPALKLKENPVKTTSEYQTLNVETYGGGIWYSFFDRPLKIAGRVVKSENGRVYSETVESPFLVSIPSLAAHMNRNVNESFAVNPQTDLLPLIGLGESGDKWLEEIAGSERVLSYDLYLVNADTPYSFGVNGEFFAAPRIDNLASVCASVEALLAHAAGEGVCVAAMLDSEEIGSRTRQGAESNFLEVTLRRIAYAFHFDDNEFFKALASSFLLSVDNAHAMHPNHPEKSDVTNKTTLGKGVAIKAHANKAYTTDALSCAALQTVFERAGVAYQYFYNRSDMRSGSTLGAAIYTALGVASVDIGLPQLAMHSACECFAKSDYTELVNGLTAFYSSDIKAEGDGFIIR